MSKIPTRITMEFTPDGASVKVFNNDSVIGEVTFEQQSRGTSTMTSRDFFEQFGDNDFAEEMDDALSFLPLTVCSLLWECREDFPDAFPNVRDES